MLTKTTVEYQGLFETYHPWWGGSSKNVVVTSSSQMMSQNHSSPYGTKDGDNGGPFILVKEENKVSPAMIDYYWGGYSRGPLLPGSFVNTANDCQIPSAALMLPSSLEAEGATLVSKSLPTAPAFSLPTAMGEFATDGLPAVVGTTLLKDRAKYLRDSGNEYLNVQFGWLPLVSDVRKFAHTVKNSHKIINSFRKNANKDLRRRRQGPSVTRSQFSTGGVFPYPIDWNFFGDGQASYSYSDKLWFSGAFRYYLPVGDTTAEKMERYEAYANQLLGTRLTPSLVWELAPWSWAADWFTNTGDVLKNVSALGSDGLVMRYGYVMRESKSEMIRTATFVSQETYQKPVTASWIKRGKTCQRLAANPYGFGIDLESLSARQISVLVALGLSRASV